jgi:hypothetical protein
MPPALVTARAISTDEAPTIGDWMMGMARDSNMAGLGLN